MDRARMRLNAALYRKVYRIRQAEQAIIRHYGEDEMKTPMHMSWGEEALAAGVALALGRSHQAVGYYRSHALYLAMADETEMFFGEMYGKVTGALRGKGGSMHLSLPECGLIMTSAVVGSTIAPAIGAAFANKARGTGKVVAAFFGDGAVEEGVFSEALNMACVMKLPVLFVCADNGLAVDVTASERQGFRSIPALAEAYRCSVFCSASTDVERIYRLARRAIDAVAATGQPSFLHLRYCRFLQHIGISDDFQISEADSRGGFEKTKYRSLMEYKTWMAKEPAKNQRRKLRRLGVAEESIRRIERAIEREVQRSLTKARRAAAPAAGELYTSVYAE